MKKFILLLFILTPLFFYGQKKEAPKKKKLTIKFSGFVKNDIFFDSRQTVAAREGHFLLYPKEEELDPVGADINAKANFNMLSIQSRARVLVKGPDVLGAKLSAFLEGAFFGANGSDANEFRLRHAFVKLTWANNQLLIGQYWHPLFITHDFPGTVSFNTGAPFTPFSRNPQIRFTHFMGNLRTTITALSQRDFASFGPSGASSIYLRNAAFPAVNIRVDYDAIDKENKSEMLIGGSINYKSLHPSLATASKYKSTSEISSISYAAYAKYQTAHFAFKLYGFYGEDAPNLTMIGGYAVHAITNTTTNEVSYTALKTASTWAETYYKKNNWQMGIFFGYSKNLGANDTIGGTVYGRGYNIANLYRIAPRLILNYGKFRIAPELEYTVASYATKNNLGRFNIDNHGVVTDSKSVGNLRLLVGVYYFF